MRCPKVHSSTWLGAWEALCPLLFLLLLAARAGAQNLGTWQPIPLPDGVGELAAFAQCPSGELFAASSQRLYVRSPFGDERGWEPVRGLVVANDDQIVDLTAISGSPGHALVVVTRSRVHSVEWSFARADKNPWDGLRYRFTCRTIAESLPISLSSVRSVSEPGPESRLRALAFSSSGAFAPIAWRGDRLELDAIVELTPGAADLQWAPGADGVSFVWAYGTSRLWKLSSTGKPSRPLDVAALMSPAAETRRFVDIQDVWYDAHRLLTFIGTSHGLAVVDNAWRTPLRVKSVQTGIKHIGATAQRMWIVVERADAISGQAGPLLMEAAAGRRPRSANECADMTFFAPTENPGPESVATALTIDDDLVLVQAADSEVWEWSPGSWRRIPEFETALTGFSLGMVGARGRAPVVVGSLLRDRLAYKPPPSTSYWYVRSKTQDHAPARSLVPDPSGQGVWRLGNGAHAATTYGVLTFETPFGSLPGTHGVSGGPRRLNVRAMSLAMPSGRRRWPVSRAGGLLLPSGIDWIHAESGAQQLLTWPLPEGAALRCCLPGGESSSTAWLAIHARSGQRNEVVRVDLEEGAPSGSAAKLVLESTTLQSAAEEPSVLFADSTGYVWFGVEGSPTGLSEKRWQAHAVSAVSATPSRTLDLGVLPAGESPVYLWLTPDEDMFGGDHLLFTQHGVRSIHRHRPTPRNQIPVGPRPRPPGPWRRLRSGPQPNSRFDHVIHSPALHPNEPRAWRRIVMMRRDGTFGPDSELGEAWEFPVDAPTHLTPIADWILPSESAISLWAPEQISRPEAVFWTPPGPRPTANVTLLHRDGVLKQHRLSVPHLAGWSRVIPVAPHESAIEGHVDYAGTDGTAIALRRAPPGGDRGLGWLPAFPRRLVVEHTAKDNEEHVVATSAIPTELPPTAHTLRLRIAPSYENWWITDLSCCELRSDADATTIPFSKSGWAEARLEPGQRHRWVITATHPWTGSSSELPELPLEVAASPPPERPGRWILMTLLTVAGVSLGATATIATWRRTVLAWLRRKHWILTCPPGTWEGSWTGPPEPGWSIHAPTREEEPIARGTSWPADGASNLPPHPTGGHLRCVRVACEPRVPVSAQRGSVAQTEDGNVVTGFVPARPRVAPRPAARRFLRFSLVFGDADRRARLRRRIRRAGFRAGHRARCNTIEQVFEDLEQSDVVIASDDALQLESWPGSSVVSAFLGREIRARLAVVAGSSPSPSPDALEILHTLAQHGIHVLWIPSTDPSHEGDLVACWMDAFLPRRGRRPASLAEALNHVVSKKLGRDPAWAENVLLIGDPSLRATEVSIYDAFLSHSREDVAWVERLLHVLRKRVGWWRARLRICRDADDFAPGELLRIVSERLAASRFLIVCCSPDAAGSRWVRKEIQLYLRDHSPATVLLCDVGPGDPGPDESERLAGFYAELEALTGRRDLLRVDLAPSSTPPPDDEPSRRKTLPLIAAITGIDLSQLRGS